MGRKSNYFRHSLDAHNDPKLMKLLQRGKLKAVGAFWIILEIYGRQYMDDDEQNIKQELNVRHIANAIGLRSDSTRTVIELITDCKLIESLWCKSDVSSVQVSIPNFLKYFGRYQKTEQVKCPNKRKEKKRKEKKRKPSENLASADVVSIINTLNQKTGKHYKSTGAKTKQLINSRLSEKFSLEDFERVIDIKCREWKGTDFEKFLRPETLFGNKFEGYLQEYKPDVLEELDKNEKNFYDSRRNEDSENSFETERS